MSKADVSDASRNAMVDPDQAHNFCLQSGTWSSSTLG